ncbi:MAG TPA: glycosyltransferase family 1 protein, partial [Aeromonadales bacterium]|nr:glycosyltransferase family 1 protein [Aeromonadales bacterium]
VINALSALRGGGQTYIVNFLKYLPDGNYKILLLVNTYNRTLFERFKSDKVELYEAKWASKSIFHRTYWELFLLPDFLKKRKATVYYAPGGLMLTKIPDSVISVTALRNMLPFDKRERKRFNLVSYIRFKLWLLKFLFLFSYKFTDKVVFISDYSRSIVKEYITDIEKKSILIPHGLNKKFLKTEKNYQLPDFLQDNQFYLYVSILDVYKAQKEVVNSWKLLIKQGINYPLVLVGPNYNEYGESVLSMIKAPELQGKVIYLGNVDYDDLPGLYKASRALIFASSCECCPNILLEKLGASKPVLCSNIEPMPEFGGEAVIYFDPYKPESLCCEVLALENDADKMKLYAEKAGEQALKYNWEQTVKKTIDYLLEQNKANNV